jgi:hypothetical protein
MKEYIAPLLRFGALILLLTTIYEQNNVINKYKDKAKSQVDRYEVALELFKEKNKKAADEFELILLTQTK